jgi:hypothetical protein
MSIKLKNSRASGTISSMKHVHDERGSVNGLLISVILLGILFVGTGSFAAWAFTSRQDYKNNSDTKAAVAVAANKQKVQASDALQYAEAAKNPLKTYIGSDAYGGVHVSYPKTWGAYVDTSDGNTPLNAYFHSDYVPAVNGSGPTQATYNLRVQVVATSYSSQMEQYSAYILSGKMVATPYKLPKVPSVTGTEFTGTVNPNNQAATGVMVMLPVRDKTLLIWTESPTYLADFNTYILPNLTFSP